MRIIVLLGPPGAGKGTLASSLSKSEGLAVFVTGDVLRSAIAEGSELGQRVRADVETGRLVDDATILALVREFLTAHSEGVLFDGFPRTLRQAEGLRLLLSDDDELRVVYLDASEDTILSRLTSRRVCPRCGRIYNLRFKPPLNKGLCDADNEPLVQRKDDTEEVIRKRYQLYLKETEPLIEYFAGELIRVDGDMPSDKLLEAVRGQLCPA